MNIIETIKIVNEMRAEKVFENYALSGAAAVIFYTEPRLIERTKDFLRISLFLENDLVNMKELEEILARHDLNEKWKKNKHRLIR